MPSVNRMTRSRDRSGWGAGSVARCFPLAFSLSMSGNRPLILRGSNRELKPHRKKVLCFGICGTYVGNPGGDRGGDHGGIGAGLIRTLHSFTTSARHF
jgi:hypothetical protein